MLSVREDFLARIVEEGQRLEPGIPIVRLEPLRPDGARDAIVGPLANQVLLDWYSGTPPYAVSPREARTSW